MTLKAQVQLKIRKPVAQVFDAVVDHRKLAGYFIEVGSGSLVGGTTVTWKFPELDEAFPVSVREVVPHERLALEWGSMLGGPDNRVEFVFTPMNGEETMVQVTESGWPDTDEGVKASQGNAGGWMFMLSALKGYLEYGVNLRAGGLF
ncbi:SRPBCC domain-containing protein [Caulobacter sp.]|uniref:SRPBCC domain-containing protein n=1 Tax=Caulobacter sp. TaxID=78 RepID=UPI003BA84A39